MESGGITGAAMSGGSRCPCFRSSRAELCKLEDEMSAIAMILVACLPHTSDCRQTVEHPATQEECEQRAERLQQTLPGTMDDAGYRPVEITCLYQPKDGPRG